jgi:uncharacterized membrane protein YfcA
MAGTVPCALTTVCAPVLGAVHLTAGRDLLLVLAGFGAGVCNGVAGGGTLVSFPTLLALGYPALTANVTSTVGIWPGYLGGTAGFRTEIGDQRDHVRQLAPLAAVGAVLGALLLLTTPSKDFARIAPWLVLFAAALFAVQPLLVRAFTLHHTHPLRRWLLLAGTLLAAVYGGYFGAGMGIVLLAVLGLALPDTLARTSGMRTILSVLVNGVAALVFVVHGSLVWAAAGLLAIGSLVGGWAGARGARRLPAPALRVAVVAIGVATGIALLVG